MARKSGLGRGLDLLIPISENELEKNENETEKSSKTGKTVKKSKSVKASNADKKVNKDTDKDSNKDFAQDEIDNLAAIREETGKAIMDSVTKNGVIEIKLNDIEPNKKQPRVKFNEDKIIELADSIKQHGIIQPLVVQKKDDYYEIIAGERRWRAAKIAGLTKVPVVIKDYSEQEIIEIALIENVQREDLNQIEEANAYQRLMEEFHLTQDALAERISKSRSAIANTIRLLGLCDEVKELLSEEMISGGHARALLPIKVAGLQYKIAMITIDQNASVREVESCVREIGNAFKTEEKQEKLLGKIMEEEEKRNGESIVEIKDVLAIIRNMTSEKKTKDPIDNAFIYENIAEKIKETLGTKVQVKHNSNGKGKIEIEYYSNDELDRIYNMLLNINTRTE